ncbi:conserved protein, unknown function [Hepatocystis sp. ex Piliocolobus tephrosceles]|nr:conserved protein, unknown function [Hepatocystis sp. ex Piliocolobus tephrosceles]
MFASKVVNGNSNDNKKKDKSMYEQRVLNSRDQCVSLPAVTAFFLCKVKMVLMNKTSSISSSSCSSGSRQNDSNPSEQKVKELYNMLLNSYNNLTNFIKETMTEEEKKKKNSFDMLHGYNDKSNTSKFVHINTDDRSGQINAYNNSSSISGSSNVTHHYNKKIKKNRTLPYLITNKMCLSKEDINFSCLLKDYFFGAHEVNTLSDLKHTLSKTVKYLEKNLIHFNVNYKNVPIQAPIYNEILYYVSDLLTVVKECLYTVILSQRCIHKPTKKYVTKELVNYFVNKV